MSIKKVIEKLIENELEAAFEQDSDSEAGIPLAEPNYLALCKTVIIRTVTYHYVGRVKRVSKDGFLVLEDCSWVADSGRWNSALVNGTLDEVEPMPGLVGINIASIIDISEWNHALPKEVK